MTIARRLAPLLLLLGACAKREAALPRSVAPTDEEIWIIARAGETSGRTSTPHAPRMLAGTTPDATPLAQAVYDREVVLGEQLVVENPVAGRDVPILVNSAPLSDSEGAPAGVGSAERAVLTHVQWDALTDQLQAERQDRRGGRDYPGRGGRYPGRGGRWPGGGGRWP